jgi:hypothetical protein
MKWVCQVILLILIISTVVVLATDTHTDKSLEEDALLARTNPVKSPTTAKPVKKRPVYKAGMPPFLWGLMAVVLVSTCGLTFYILGGPESCAKEGRNCRRKDCCCKCCRLEGDEESWLRQNTKTDLRMIYDSDDSLDRVG